MGACDWLCCCCDESGESVEEKPPPAPPSPSPPITTAPKKASLRLIIAPPGKVEFNLDSFNPLTPRTPANEVPSYVKVKPLIGEPTPQSVTFNVRSSRDTLISREDMLQKLDRAIQGNKKMGKMTTVLSQEPTLFPGGNGKTETIRKFIEAHAQRYNHVLWIDAESRITIQNSFLNLAESLGKYIYDEADATKYKRVSSLAKETFRVLLKEPCLVVLDNLGEEFSSFREEPHFVKEFLPTFMEDRVKPVILITSNFWTTNCVKLDPLPEDNCTSFLLAQLEMESNEENRGLALQISKMASGSPLLLEMTVAQIQIQAAEDTIGLGLNPLQDFIEDFRQSERRVLPLRPPEAKSDSYLHVLLMSTIHKIVEDPGRNRIGMNCLNVMAYLPSVKIPKKMLASFFPLESAKTIAEALKLLRNYSLVQDAGDFLEMHPMVQEALIEIVSMNIREDKVLEWTVKEISSILNQISPQDKHYRDVLACAIQIEFHVKDKYSNLMYLDFAKLVQDKIAFKYFEKSYEIAERISKYHEEVNGKEHRGTLMAQNDMALALFNQKKYAEAVSRFEQILDPAQRFLGSYSEPSLILSFKLAVAFTKMGKYEEAEELYELTLEGRKKAHGEDLATLEIEYHLASLLHQRDDNERALEITTALLPKRIETSGPAHIETLNIRILRASVLRSMGGYEEALEELSDVMEFAVQEYGEAHPVFVNALRQQTKIRILQGQQNEGLKIFFKILELQLKHFVLDPETAMETNSSMGQSLVELRRFDEALRLYAQASDFARAVLDENDPMLVANEANIGAVLNIQGRIEEAMEMYARVYDRQKESLGVDHVDTLDTKNTIMKLASSSVNFGGTFGI